MAPRISWYQYQNPSSVWGEDMRDILVKALNYYVMGVHQPLIVKNGDTVTGLLRFGDIFEVVRERILNCNLE